MSMSYFPLASAFLNDTEMSRRWYGIVILHALTLDIAIFICYNM